MRFKSKILIVFFAFAVLSPVFTQAMGETPKTQKASRMCDMSGDVKKFVLRSGNGEVRETFKVPVRYMSMELERNGRVNNSLHLDTVFGSLEPRCQDNGQPLDQEEALQVRLSPNVRTAEEWERLSRQVYADTDTFQFEEITIEGYSDFSFKALKRRPAPVEGATARYSYIPVHPKNETGIPTYFYISCGLGKDMKTLGLCNIRFLYPENNHISVTAYFPSKELNNIEEIYSTSNDLIKKFHVK